MPGDFPALLPSAVSLHLSRGPVLLDEARVDSRKMNIGQFKALGELLNF